MMKICTKCETALPATKEFFNVQGIGLTPRCKVCLREDQADWYKRNKGRKLAKVKASSYKRNFYKDYLRTVKRKYGLSEQGLRDLMDEQKGCCAICGKSLVNPEFKREDLAIDHDHLTGEVRGLLCYKCNVSLGNFNDDIGLLLSAVRYLGRGTEEEAIRNYKRLAK